MSLQKVVDLLMFRLPSDEDSHSREPQVTVGSIVWGILLRSIVLVLLVTLALESLALRQYWWMMLFIIWFAAAYPGWIQYKKYQERMDDFKESTLCGSCAHFDSGSQLCRLHDEHVSSDYIPCDGLDWEPVNDDE